MRAGTPEPLRTRGKARRGLVEARRLNG